MNKIRLPSDQEPGCHGASDLEGRPDSRPDSATAPSPHAETAEAVIARLRGRSRSRAGACRGRGSAGEVRGEPAPGGAAAPDVAAIPRPVPRAARGDPDRRGRRLRLAGRRDRHGGHPGHRAPERRHRLHPGGTGRARCWRPCNGCRRPWPRSCGRGSLQSIPAREPCARRPDRPGGRRSRPGRRPAHPIVQTCASRRLP